MPLWLKRIQSLLTPERMQKVNLVGAVFNLLCALGTILIGLPSEFTQIFLASGLCFIASGLANWQIARIKSKNNK